MAHHRGCQHGPFLSTYSMLTCRSRKAQVLLITLTMAQLHSSVPVSHDSMTVCQHPQNQDPETGEAKHREAAIVTYIISNQEVLQCVFPSVTCLNVFCGKKKSPSR